MYTSIIMPYRITFGSSNTNDNSNTYKDAWSIVENFINFVFLIDIFLTFFTSIYDNVNQEIIVNKKVLKLKIFKILNKKISNLYFKN